MFELYEVEKTGIDDSEASSLRFNFSTNNSGDISALAVKFESTLEPLEFKRKAISILVDESVLESYVGDYDLSGTIVNVYIKNKKLYVFLAGQPEYELLALAKDKFSIKILDGYKVQFNISDNKVSELLFIQPNGTFKARRK